VDFQKVHTALERLQQNNKFYKDIPAYTVTELEAMVNKQLSVTSERLLDQAA